MTPPNPSTPALFGLLLALIGALAMGCGSEGFEHQPCPVLSHASGVVYELGAELRFGGEPVEGDLQAGLYGAHAIAVPLEGDVTLTISGTLGRGVIAMFLYGPRASDGVFGTCKGESPQISGGSVAALTYVVPEGQGGEYLLLVSRNPVAEAKGTYTVSLTCSGDRCDGAACPLLMGNCPIEVCPSGFAVEPMPPAAGAEPDDDAAAPVDGPDCPVCACASKSCGPFEELVVDKCVCACKVPATPEAVCGDDGQTYLSACFASCAGVAISREGSCGASCPPLGECTLDCPFGLKVVDGCKKCECKGACDQVPAHYQPVCGTDGLSYTSIARLRCDAPGVEVAYTGNCLPFCELPDCNLSCPNGYAPRYGTGSKCFLCQCAEPAQAEPTEACESGGKPWCALKAPPTVGATGTPAAPPLIPATMGRYRTFADECTAKKAGWKPLLGAACPNAACSVTNDCKIADAVLVANFPGIDQLIDENAAAEGTAIVACNTQLAGTVGACIAGSGKPLPCQPKTGSASPCPKGSKCQPDDRISAGGRCVFDCACLNKTSGRIFAPVCATLPNGQQMTFFNVCVAFCRGAIPIDYPGRCCEKRKTTDELFQHYQKIDALCQGYEGEGLRARYRLDTDCPPPPAICLDESNKMLCCTKGPEGDLVTQ